MSEENLLPQPQAEPVQLAPDIKAKKAKSLATANDAVEGIPEAIKEEYLLKNITESQRAPEKVGDSHHKQNQELRLSIDAAARNFAEGYRSETHLKGLKSFCDSTGYPSEGTVEQMISSLKAYGYPIKSGG